jgi:hypothetical protein
MGKISNFLQWFHNWQAYMLLKWDMSSPLIFCMLSIFSGNIGHNCPKFLKFQLSWNKVTKKIENYNIFC